MFVGAWLARAASTHPQRTALQAPAARCSYAELLAAAAAGARELGAAGVRPGDRVAIEFAPGIAFAQALHACLLHGAVAAPIDTRLAQAERERCAAGSALIVREPLAAPSRAPGTARGVREVAGARHDLDAVAVVIHTSGTTAAARAVELTYGNLLWSALGSAVALGVNADERWLCTLPVCHVGGLSILLRSCIYATTAVVHERFDVERTLHALRVGDVTLVSVVATMLARLLDAGLERPPSLRCALAGGGPLPGALLERSRSHGVPVALTYGLTEACSQVTTEPVAALAPGGQARTDSPPTAGPPLFCTRVRVAPDGEILVRGPTVAPGAVGADGWLHTGDLGALDGAGRLAVTGRRADTIVSGGENISPAEVEAALEGHPDVLEAGVVGASDPTWGEIVTAVVVARPGSSVSAESLRAHCARALAPYKAPKQVTLVGGPLPRTPSGKLLRRQLPAAHRQRWGGDEIGQTRGAGDDRGQARS
jgi:o-succinylbenzoate---CoA ligase